MDLKRVDGTASSVQGVSQQEQQKQAVAQADEAAMRRAEEANQAAQKSAEAKSAEAQQQYTEMLNNQGVGQNVNQTV